MLLRFFLAQAQRHQLGDLVSGDLADGGLLDQRGVHVPGGHVRHGFHHHLVRDNGVAGGVAATGVVAIDHGVEGLLAVALGEDDFAADEAGVIGYLCPGDAPGRVHLADLVALHLQPATPGDFDVRHRVQHALTAAVALAVVLLDVFDPSFDNKASTPSAYVQGLLDPQGTPVNSCRLFGSLLDFFDLADHLELNGLWKTRPGLTFPLKHIEILLIGIKRFR